MDPEEFQVSGQEGLSRGDLERVHFRSTFPKQQGSCPNIGNPKVKRNRPLSFSPALQVMDATGTRKGMAEMCVQPGGR